MSQDDSIVPLPVAQDFSPRLPHKDHLAFGAAIHERKCVRVTFYKEENEAIQDRDVEVQTCVPWDYGPMLYGNATPSRYQFIQRDEESWGGHFRQFSLFPSQIIGMEKLEADFEPMEFMRPDSNWCLYRQWHFPLRKS